MSGSHFAI